MNDRKAGPAKAGGQQQELGSLEQPSHASKQLQVRELRNKRARAYNSQHAKEAAEFQKLTGINPLNIAAVKKWQSEHNVTSDGKIGPNTLKAAKPQAPDAEDAAFQVPDVSFSPEEAEEDAKAKPESALDEATGGGEGGLKESEHKGDLNEGDTIAAEGVGKIGEDIAEDTMEKGAAQTATTSAAARILLVPRLVTLLREHKYSEALADLRKSVGQEERVELLKLALEKAEIKLSEKMMARFVLAAAIGASVDAVLVGFEWFELGINAIAEAHERGERDSINEIYSWAYADTLINGEHSNPGAISAEQIEARQKGIEMGHVAREQCPELPFLLQEEYGKGQNAMHAVQDQLLAKAGIHVRNHSGR